MGRTTFFFVIVKKSVRTAVKTQHVPITKLNLLMPSKEIIFAYSGSHTKPINTFCGQNAFIYYSVLSIIRANVGGRDA
jgi:hypothetical protein